MVTKATKNLHMFSSCRLGEKSHGYLPQKTTGMFGSRAQAFGEIRSFRLGTRWGRNGESVSCNFNESVLLPIVDEQKKKRSRYSCSDLKSIRKKIHGKHKGGMQENTSAQVHRSGRKSKAYSKHDHKCHKVKHKSTESLLEKADRSRNRNYLSEQTGSWSALSVDSGLSQTKILPPLEVQFGLAYLKNENAKLINDLEKVSEENEEIKLRNSAIRSENENLKADISLMKNLVYKLNLELEKFQNGGRKFEGADKKIEKLPKCYEKNFLKPVLPLLKAFNEALQEKDETIRDLESEYKKFNFDFNALIQENEKLYVELEKKLARADGGVYGQIKFLKRDLEMAKQENDLLLQQIKLEREKLTKVHSVFRVKVEEASKAKDELNITMEESKSELLVIKGKYAVLKQEFERLKMENDTRVPLAVYSASINECQKLFQDLKTEYEHERHRLVIKIKEQEGILTKQNKLEEEWTSKKNQLEKSNFNQFSEMESLRKKVSELEKLLEENGRSSVNEKDRRELIESKRQLRESGKQIEELSSKLAVTKKQLQKAMLFAEDIVRGQEGLLLQLHAKQKENNYMTTQFGSLKSQLKDVERGAQKDLNTIEEKIKSLEAENYALAVHNRKLEKLLGEKEELIRKLEPTKDLKLPDFPA